MKKLIIFCISIFILSYVINHYKNKSKLKKINDKDFAIKDINSVTKIIMTDKEGNSILLEKKDKNWKLNNRYEAWEHQVDYTLNVMKDIKIKSSVPEESEKMVIKNLATSAVKIEIYTNNNSIKTYYIGGNTRDHLGTYMIMKGSSMPFIMHIPERQPGILNPKFGLEGNLVNENIWREPIIISITPSNSIEEIIVQDIINTNQSFFIKNKELRDLNDNKIPIDTMKIDIFFSNFKKLECGKFKPHLKISDLTLSKKIYITHNNKTDSLIIYETTKQQRTQREFNSTVENLYATWNNSDLVIIQKQIFNKVLITLNQFVQ